MREDILLDRQKKLTILKEAGMESYPATSDRTHELSEVVRDFSSLETAQTKVVVSGRVMSRRGQGALSFVDLYDGSGRLQAVLKKDELDQALYELFVDAVDQGDFIEVTGVPFTTQRGQQSILVGNWRMLSKSLRPLPDEWYGLKDEDERYRKRYLDILLNPELRELFEQKAKFWDVTRSFMKDRGFFEVDTPSLELTTGGAEARPFKTYHHDFDLEVYLRISVGELWQKKLMAAGIPKTFEIGRVYRNEGSSQEHLQEFTNLEFYSAYADYRAGMQLVRDLYVTIAQEVFGKTEFTSRGHTFDLTHDWVEIDYVEEVRKQTGVSVISAPDDELKSKLTELGVTYEGETRERLVDTLWKYCRKNIAGPAFLVNHPVLVAPLAKVRSENPATVEMFQPIIAGSEVGRGYSELNDPIDQKQRFEMQQKLIEAGDEEAMMPDWEFVEMLEHGMPPTCGFGFGERLFAFLADKPLRETQYFPLMRPREWC